MEKVAAVSWIGPAPSASSSSGFIAGHSFTNTWLLLRIMIDDHKEAIFFLFIVQLTVQLCTAGKSTWLMLVT